MLTKLFTLTIIFGLVAADPIMKNTEVTTNPDSERSLERRTRDIERLPILIGDFVETLFGYKQTSLSLAVSAIDWVMSNIPTIAIGAAAVFGVCKITDACGFDKPVLKEQYINYITDEQLDTAERFLFNAMQQYVERKRREV